MKRCVMELSWEPSFGLFLSWLTCFYSSSNFAISSTIFGSISCFSPFILFNFCKSYENLEQLTFAFSKNAKYLWYKVFHFFSKPSTALWSPCGKCSCASSLQQNSQNIGCIVNNLQVSTLQKYLFFYPLPHEQSSINSSMFGGIVVGPWLFLGMTLKLLSIFTIISRLSYFFWLKYINILKEMQLK